MLRRACSTLPPLFLLLLSLCAWGTPQFTGSDRGGPGIGSAALATLRQEQPPTVTAASALLLDDASGTLLWARRPQVRRAPASLTKMMTALVVRAADPVSSVFTISALAAATPGSRMNLVAGQRLTVQQLLYGLLLPSGNDAAVALAQGTAGSIPAFVAQMNARAAAMGLTGTHFVNPHGLDATDHYSTALDLANLGAAVLRDPVLAQIVRTPQEIIRASDGQVLFDLQNLNQLLGVYPGVDGIKTGTTTAAGENLVVADVRDGHQVIAVVLGSADRYADARALLDMGWADWRWLQPQLPPLATLDG
ncbi:MAG TPA: D-alanyl-D-alanine carboxypeptidase family protein, partial [Chloroflexota bacterium]|nr:D-alanyl-D-alanine carboxypeptidase family protein [Chloroflexota bacterium]